MEIYEVFCQVKFKEFQMTGINLRNFKWQT